MSQRYIKTSSILQFLSKNPRARSTFDLITKFVEANSIDIHLGWDEDSIAEVLTDAERGSEYELLTAEQKQKILLLFTKWTVNNNISELESSLLEAVDVIQNSFSN